MATKQLMLPGKTVKKSNALARARWSPESVWEPRLVAMVAAQIKADDTDFQPYEIRLRDLLGKDPGGENYKKLKAAALRTVGRVICIDEPQGWVMYSLFARCRLDAEKGTIEVLIDPELKSHFLQLKQYIKYNILEFMLLPSVYSQRLFEFLKSWADQKEIIAAISELHEMLDVPKSFIEDFRQFRTRVLEKAHKDILKFTELYYTWEAIKEGRTVKWIKFTFGKRPKAALKSPDTAAEKPVKHLAYEKFLQRFPNASAYRLKAHKAWSELESLKIAPQAGDVPENNELEILEFLAQWRAAHEPRGEK